eukprot:scaffold111562_cov19-Tisochrysis_lutea.AAC.1
MGAILLFQEGMHTRQKQKDRWRSRRYITEHSALSHALLLRSCKFQWQPLEHRSREKEAPFSPCLCMCPALRPDSSEDFLVPIANLLDRTLHWGNQMTVEQEYRQ